MVERIYKKLYVFFGPQRWWPAESPFEVMVGAILTQNTNWRNVEKALANLKVKKLLDPWKLRRVSRAQLAKLIRPAGYYNIKARRLMNFLDFFLSCYQGDIRRMRKNHLSRLRRELLSVNGIGFETADSMLLYALDKPVFVVDAYTKRISVRHGLVKEGATYDEVQQCFTRSLPKKAKLFNEYHALFVRVGKEFCLKSKARCSVCPLKE